MSDQQSVDTLDAHQELIEEAKKLGIKPHHLWKVETLQKKIDQKKKALEPAPEG